MYDKTFDMTIFSIRLVLFFFFFLDQRVVTYASNFSIMVKMSLDSTEWYGTHQCSLI